MQHLIKPTSILSLAMPLAAAMLLSGPAHAAKQKAPEPVALTEAGEKLLSQYDVQMAQFKDELMTALPKIDETKVQAYQKTRAAELAVNPFFPRLGPATGSFNGLHPQSNFLAMEF